MARRGLFDFNQTCPIINTNLDRVRSDVHDIIYDHLRSLIPGVSGTVSNEIADEIFRCIADEIENVRSTNVDMRAEAERQIEALQQEIADLTDQISELENSRE